MKKSTPAAGPVAGKDHPNVLPLEGEIDLHISPNVTASLSMMIEKKPKQLIVDLSRVTYIDSSGLAALIEGMQNAEEYGGKFALAGLQEVFDIVIVMQAIRLRHQHFYVFVKDLVGAISK